MVDAYIVKSQAVVLQLSKIDIDLHLTLEPTRQIYLENAGDLLQLVL